MTRGVRRTHAARALAALGLAAVAIGAFTPQAVAEHTKRARPAQAQKIQLRVTNVSPSVAPSSPTPSPLVFGLTLTNPTGTALRGVTVVASRDEPIGSQEALDGSLTDPAALRSDAPRVPATGTVRVDVPAHSSVPAVFTTRISQQNTGTGVCQCANLLYPIVFRATQDDSVLGSTTTYVPSQLDPTEKTRVSWLWPLIDRPHRLTDDTVFTDDDLASSVLAGGRLDRALQVVELLNPAVPMTLVIDPELLDELQVMAGGRYTVSTSDGAVPGTGQAAATAWLSRLAALITTHPNSRISLTPYADPDVQSLTRAGVGYTTTLPEAMQRRVTLALRGRATDSDVAWPAGGVVDGGALNALRRSGATTVVLDGSSLRPSSNDGVPVAVARLRTSGGVVTAAATAPAVQRLTAEAVGAESNATTGSTALPYLVAETTIRSIQAGDAASDVVLTPPRYVDPVPARAVRAIQATSSNAYATPVDVRQLRADRPAKSSSIRSSATKVARSLPSANLDAAALANRSAPAIAAMLARDRDARNIPGGLGAAAQRVTSSAWLPATGSPFPASTGAAFANQLATGVRGYLDGVHIVRPTAGSGNYTLGSKDSSLPITVQNDLPYSVEVDLSVASKDGLPGYRMRSIGAQRIAARSKQTVQVPSHLDRSGRIAVEARLTAPTDPALGRSIQLGDSIQLNVRSTVFGFIGIVITVVAGAVLVIALVVRFTRRLQRLGRKKAQAVPAHPSAEKVST